MSDMVFCIDALAVDMKAQSATFSLQCPPRCGMYKFIDFCVHLETL